MSQSFRQSFVAYGVRIELLANDRDTLQCGVALLPTGAKAAVRSDVDVSYTFETDRSAQAFALVVDGQRCTCSDRLEDILVTFEQHITLRIAERAPFFTFVHAGVVAWQNRAIIFPGYSFSGKTTLVADLVRSGAVYYSDEYAVFDAEGRVHPYPRPLQIRQPGNEQQIPLTVHDLGGVAGLEPLEVAVIAFCRYEPHRTWQPQSVSQGRAVLELFKYTMSAQYAPERALNALSCAVATAQLLQGKRGETSQMIDFLSHAFGTTLEIC